MGITILLGSLVIFILLGIPICFALGASGFIYFFIENPGFINILPQRIWAGTNSFVLIALPLFILAGNLMNKGGITRRIIDFSLYLVRPIKGGLGEVNVVASMIFGGISGSSVADTSAIGSVLIPQMEEKGYSKGFSAGVTVASSTMGMIIPPSIPMLMFAMISQQSVGALFLAGAIPGLLIGLTQIVMVSVISRKKGYIHEIEDISFKQFLRSSWGGILAVLMPVFIIFSISFGIATATESAGIAVLYSLILGFFVYKELKFKDLWDALLQTILFSSVVLFIVGFSTIYTWVLSIEQVPQTIAAFLTNLNIHRYWVLIIVDLIILVIGTFVDVPAALYLLSPILLPVMASYGIHPLQFGAMMIVGLAIGLVTPPVGMCLNAATKICGLSITKIARHALPFIVCNIIVLLLVTFVPEVSTWLPSIVFK
ncbi:TRAP transporter large permease [Oceanispirochaeta crateris]|uniref:TRAP transporter large permease n=1 Tax=Oceanispirochaeta crateris TaxID=2518645 RepID=A0A5C1QNG3_9SPIO|nr:TRAP transporter large permease [Oceanispirochaeta crateris]QEN09635.1 TRAP transporter large permease [Oceanispirochaeta crateris]